MKGSGIYCYFGHHKCGTGWIRGIVQDLCRRAGLMCTTVYDVEASCPVWALEKYLRQEKINFLCYTNADLGEVMKLGSYRGFHVIRDPRDIIVSAYFSHMNSHTLEGWPELVSHREKLKSMGKDDGLLLQMEFIKPFLELMRKWNYSNPDVLEVKMEELIAEPEKLFLDIFRFLGVLSDREPSMGERLIMGINPLNQRGRGRLPFGWPLSPIRIPMERLPKDVLLKIVENNSFSRLSGGRKQGEENVASHYRKGKAGDWVNHFKPQHVEYFSSLYGELLVKLGYEQNQPALW